jgi:hypothetical protein
MIRFRHRSQAHRVPEASLWARLGEAVPFLFRTVRDAAGFAFLLGWCGLMLLTMWSLL